MHNILVSNSGDKGISLGEGTLATMDDIRVQGSKIALASKDSSKATLTHGVFSNNFIGVAAYRKKNLFKGGTIDITNTLLADNEYDFGVQVCPGKKKGNLKDCSSEISIENSKYKVRNRTFKTIIRAPTKKITSKKKFLLASWDGSLSDYGYKQVTLNDYKINKKINPLRSAQTLGPRNPLGIPSLMASLPTWTSPDK